MADDERNENSDASAGTSDEGAPVGETGEQGNDTGASENGSNDSSASDVGGGEPVEVETAKYRITGLVDYFDEQSVIRGQFPIGSEQELPVEVGDKAVELGTAERVE